MNFLCPYCGNLCDDTSLSASLSELSAHYSCQQVDCKVSGNSKFECEFKDNKLVWYDLLDYDYKDNIYFILTWGLNVHPEPGYYGMAAYTGGTEGFIVKGNEKGSPTPQEAVKILQRFQERVKNLRAFI